MATYLQSQKTIQDKQDVWDTAREAKSNSWMMFFCEPLHIDMLMLADQQELIWITSVDTGWSLQDWPWEMEDKNRWIEGVKEIHTVSTT